MNYLHTKGRNPFLETIRGLLPEDVTALIAWQGTSPHMQRMLVQEIEEHHRGERCILVALIHDTIMGTVQFSPLHPDSDLADGEPTAYLQALGVRPEYRRQGLGSRLVVAVEVICRDVGFRRVTLRVDVGNRPAMNLYEKLGYLPFTNNQDAWEELAAPVLCLGKSLFPVTSLTSD